MQKPRFTIYLPQLKLDAVRQLADDRGMNTNTIIVLAIEEYLEKWRPERKSSLPAWARGEEE